MVRSEDHATAIFDGQGDSVSVDDMGRALSNTSLTGAEFGRRRGGGT